MPASVFITGGTGYIGNPLISRLSERGHHIRALVRPGSQHKLPGNCCERVPGNALDAASYSGHIRTGDTFVQLVGVSHPSPAKAAEFQTIDRVAGLGAIDAARQAGLQHFIYLSVAQPAPMMKSYIAARAECEAALRSSGMNATIVRSLVCPWVCPWSRPSLAFTCCYQCTGSASGSRQFVMEQEGWAW